MAESQIVGIKDFIILKLTFRFEKNHALLSVVFSFVGFIYFYTSDIKPVCNSLTLFDSFVARVRDTTP